MVVFTLRGGGNQTAMPPLRNGAVGAAGSLRTDARTAAAVRIMELPWSATAATAEAANAVLQGGLAWLAEQSPQQPCLQVSTFKQENCFMLATIFLKK